MSVSQNAVRATQPSLSSPSDRSEQSTSFMKKQKQSYFLSSHKDDMFVTLRDFCVEKRSCHSNLAVQQTTKLVYCFSDITADFKMAALPSVSVHMYTHLKPR